MWSSALDTILTTLRYLAPATLLTIFWGQQSFLFKILKHIDSAFRAIVFSSEEQKQAVLQWLAEVGPVRVEHLDTVWRHGWVLCSALDAALPGACAGHPPTRLSLKHAQIIAEHYLGVEPVFSRQELESNDSLSRHQEWKLTAYLDQIRQALSKLKPTISKPTAQRTSTETNQFTLDYAAKGSGLSAVQINNKAHFNVYPTAQQCLDPGEVTILIKGPKDTYGMAVLPPILGKSQMIRHKLLGLQSKQTYTENILPLTQGAAYLRNYGKNDMNKTYYIPKAQYDIDIDVDTRTDHVKISYLAKLEGKYSVSITSRGQSVVGSPFLVTASNNIIDILERDSFCLEHGEEIDIVDVQTDRKVVLRIVDFVTEKMLLNENGTLEKITDDEAKLLMTTDKKNVNQIYCSAPCAVSSSNMCEKLIEYRKFNKAAYKILTMQRVCKVFNNLVTEKHVQLKDEKTRNSTMSRSQQGIPDIVNSTLGETNANPYIAPNNREKIIVPESISVSLRDEISKTCYDNNVKNTINDDDKNFSKESSGLNTPDSLEIKNSSSDQLDDSIFIDSKVTLTTGNNPFLNEMFEENYVASNNLGTFVASEYETNNCQSEETRDSSITIIIDPNVTSSKVTDVSASLVRNNPFVEPNVIDIERPKTPIFKIISGEKVNRDESVYIEPKSEIFGEYTNEYVNPFFMHQFESSNVDQAPATDFIIGAPVSLPPILRAASPQPAMKSLVTPANENTINYENSEKDLSKEYLTDNVEESVYLTPLHNNMSTLKDKRGNSTEITFHSLDSSLTETIDNSNASTTSGSQYEPDQSDSERNATPRRDMWDSAYVSIDENNSSPDNNNNENTTLYDTFSKQKFSSGEEFVGFKQEEILNMGPAEREIWQTYNELKCDNSKLQEDVRPPKWELKRPMFTPIIEESDRSISLGTKDMSKVDITTKPKETDTVSVAFAELNDMYTEFFPNSESSGTPVADDAEDNQLHSMEVEYISHTNDTSVNSASGISDVKRHAEELEGTISEVQANATESVSVSQILRNAQDDMEYSNELKVATEFGETPCHNIVLEKKKYWDERIREIEAKNEATTVIPKKRRISSKQIKHDSLSKRKGKQMIKNFLSGGDFSQVKDVNQDTDRILSYKVQEQNDDTQKPEKCDYKIVEKWKKFWDDKLEVDQIQNEAKTLKTSFKNKQPTPTLQRNEIENRILGKPKSYDSKESQEKNNTIKQELRTETQHVLKQELPEEVFFKAFEISPKRFFGTSRKQIMNKIDTFLGKPEVDTSAMNTPMCQESGLVSSRISLFHNMSNTEELPWSRRKSQSLHNISRKRESEKNVSSKDDCFNIAEENRLETNPSAKNSTSSMKAEITNTNLTEVTNLQTKRSRMLENTYRKTLDDTRCETPQKNVEDVNSKSHSLKPKVADLRKKSFSKSEMDIFNKLSTNTGDDFDKYKSYDELPKSKVKSFISLYESVSKTNEKRTPTKRVSRTSSAHSHITQSNSVTLNAVPRNNVTTQQMSIPISETTCTTPRVTPINLLKITSSDTLSNNNTDSKTSLSYDVDFETKENIETTYLSLSDIDLEIIESSLDKSTESIPKETIEPAHIEYKNRFKLAKEYFQSLEELREIKKPRKLNECELLLRKQSTDSLENEQTYERAQNRVKKNIKSHSLPSSEIAKGWKQLEESQERCASEERSTTKLVKISEKFNVDDLFTDVTEGRLSRQGSLRGIPHKKAVLETFRSMENIADTTMNTYEFSDSQLPDFAIEHLTKNAQTYLKEYPYLPTTDPSKYHSRVDIKASGLISLKELKEKRPRRNSVPDLRLNANFTADL